MLQEQRPHLRPHLVTAPSVSAHPWQPRAINHRELQGCAQHQDTVAGEDVPDPAQRQIPEQELPPGGTGTFLMSCQPQRPGFWGGPGHLTMALALPSGTEEAGATRAQPGSAALTLGLTLLGPCPALDPGSCQECSSCSCSPQASVH